MEVKELTYWFDKQQTKGFEQLSFTIPPQAITTLVGANGAGKSTLLQLLAGVRQAMTGEIVINQTPLQVWSAKKRAQTIAFLPQTHTLPVEMTVEKLVSMGRLPYQGIRLQLTAHDQQAIEQALVDCDLVALRHQAFGQLSGGQQQRVRLAMLFAQEAHYLLLDEPTTYLDIYYQQECLQLIRTVQEARQVTVIMILHDLQQAFSYSDFVWGLKAGELVFQQPATELPTNEVLETVFGLSFFTQKLGNQVVILPQVKQ